MKKDRFYEQIIVKPKGKLDTFILMLKPLALFVLLVALISRRLGLIVFSSLFLYVAFTASLHYFIDYEYELTNNELVITKVRDNRKREVIACLDTQDLVEIRAEGCRSNEIPIRVSYGSQPQSTVVFNTEIGMVSFCMNLDEKMKTLLLEEKAMIEEV